jgi:PAS domain S-box-containing protein
MDRSGIRRVALPRRRGTTFWSTLGIAAGAIVVAQSVSSLALPRNPSANYGLDWVLLSLAALAVLLCWRLKIDATRPTSGAGADIRRLDELPCQIAIAGGNGRPAWANQRHLQFLGIDAAQLSGDGWLEAIHADDRSSAIAAWSHSASANVTQEIEYRMRRGDGVFCWFHVHIEPLQSGDQGTPVRALGIMTEISRWKSIEQALRDNEQSLGQFIDNVPTMIWRADPTGELEYVNRRCYEFHGIKAEEQTRERWLHLVHPDDRNMVATSWRTALDAATPLDVTYRYLRKDGVYRWMAVRASPLLNEQGKALSWYGVHTDITTQKDTEHALRNSERRLNLLIETMPAMCWRTTAQGDVDFVNRRTLEVLGTDVSAVARFSWIENIHPEDLPAMMQQWHRCIETKKSFEAIYRYKYADGRYHWSRVTAAPLCDEDTGTIISWYGAHVDIDEHIKAQELLKERARELRGFLDALPGLAWRATPKGEMQYANQQCIAYTGVPFTHLSQFGWQHTVHPDDLDHVLKTWQHSAETGEPFRVINRYRRFDGVYRWFDSRANPFRDEKGEIKNWYGINLDIDESKKTEEQLRLATAKLAQASQAAAIGELSATIAHEITQPLAAVITNGEACANWLSGPSPNLARAKGSAEAIVRNGESAAAVIKRIRALFKHAPPATEQLDLNDVIREVVHLMSDELNRKAIRIETDLEADLPRLRADRVQIQQVLINLVQNAIDSMDSLTGDPRVVRLHSHQPAPNTVGVRVLDRGCGFSDEEKIFEPFFTTKDKGLGVGLSVCRSIIEAHGGELRATLNDDQGATVEFLIPMER